MGAIGWRWDLLLYDRAELSNVCRMGRTKFKHAVYLRLINKKLITEKNQTDFVDDDLSESIKENGHDGTISDDGKELTVFNSIQIKECDG